MVAPELAVTWDSAKTPGGVVRGALLAGCPHEVVATGIAVVVEHIAVEQIESGQRPRIDRWILAAATQASHGNWDQVVPLLKTVDDTIAGRTGGLDVRGGRPLVVRLLNAMIVANRLRMPDQPALDRDGYAALNELPMAMVCARHRWCGGTLAQQAQLVAESTPEVADLLRRTFAWEWDPPARTAPTRTRNRPRPR